MKKIACLKHGLIIAAMFALSSCGSENPPAPTNNQSISDPTTIVTALPVAKIISGGNEYTFTYGSGGKLEKVNETYSHSDTWGSTRDVTEYDLVYTNGKLSTVILSSVNTSTPKDGQANSYYYNKTTSYKYNEKDLVASMQTDYVQRSEGQTNSGSYTTVLEYDAENRLVKESILENGGVEEFITYTWSGVNVAKQQFFNVGSSSGRLGVHRMERRKSGIVKRLSAKTPELEEEMIFSEFDEKENPLAILAVLEGESFGAYLSKNNAGKITYFERIDGTLSLEEEEVVEITYDSKGRPLSYLITETDNSGEATEEKMVITYKE